MHLNDLLFLLPKISFSPNFHPEMFPEYVFERGFTNSASFFMENRGASFSQFPLHRNNLFHHRKTSDIGCKIVLLLLFQKIKLSLRFSYF